MPNLVPTEEYPYFVDGILWGAPCVMHSAAGYFIGRYCFDGFQDIGARESGYYKTSQQASEALEKGFPLRQCPENSRMYWLGLPVPPTGHQ